MANLLSPVFLKPLFGLLAALLVTPSIAETLLGDVSDDNGAPIADVVVTVMPTTDRLAVANSGKPVIVKLDQQSREFIPHVLPVRVGTPVIFPNSDDIQHHVYSFSSAKQFEIKLYTGTPAKPIVFDRPGVAALGCNIHDWMLSYVFVTDAPYFTKSDASGHWAVEVPPGEYRLSLWHPDASAPIALPNDTLRTPASAALRHTINIKARRQTGKPPETLQSQGYRDEF